LQIREMLRVHYRGQASESVSLVPVAMNFCI
jgi:hypothetical protein